MKETLSYLSLANNVQRLRNLGLFRLDEKSPKLQRILHTIYMRGIILFFSLYTVQQFLKIREVSNDVDKVMGTMFLLLTNTDCIYKCIILSVWPEQVERTLNTLKGPIFNEGLPEHRNILMNTVKSAVLVTRVFTNMSVATCFLWIVHPTVLHMQGKNIEFPVWLPFDANQNPLYYVAMVYVWIQTSLLAYCNTTLDIFITFLLEQCRTQVTILRWVQAARSLLFAENEVAFGSSVKPFLIKRLNLMNLVENSKKEAIEKSSSYTAILDRRFNEIIVHHQTIVNTADQTQEIFGGAVFYQFIVSGWILCCSVYRIVGANPVSIEFLSMIMYVMCILIEIYLYCYYGNALSYESDKLIESAYNIDWLEMPVKQRRKLITFMERIKRPIKPTGYTIPLSNGTFISIIRSSYSFYAFLNNSEH